MTTTPTVGLVGHCGADSALLKRTSQRALPGCKVVRIDRRAELDASEVDVLLVNRVLGHGLDATDGIDLIRQIHAAGGPPAMLISNYQDAQDQAEQAGGMPGFGKSMAHEPEADQKLRDAVATQTSS